MRCTSSDGMTTGALEFGGDTFSLSLEKRADNGQSSMMSRLASTVSSCSASREIALCHSSSELDDWARAMCAAATLGARAAALRISVVLSLLVASPGSRAPEASDEGCRRVAVTSNGQGLAGLSVIDARHSLSADS